MIRALCLTLFATALQLVSVHASGMHMEMIEKLLKEARQRLAPDHRTAVFDIQGRVDGETLVLAGEIHSRRLLEQLLELLRTKGHFTIKDSITVLPQAALGDSIYGVVNVSVGNLRGAPGHSAELVSQALLGTPLKVLKKQRSWYYVQTPDDYLGWMGDGFCRMNHEQIARWEAEPKVIVTEDCGVARSSLQDTARAVSDVVAGAILALKKDMGEAFQVEYPDGRTAYLSKRGAQPFVQWLSEANATPDRLIATAMRFIGIPYLWGGTSGKGFDCSGLTKVVYFLNGIHLPRDAGQQATTGTPVDPGTELEHAVAGDLLFFGSKADSSAKQRVTHVGLYLGNRKFINASSVPGYVVITSLNPVDAEYSADREESFLLARRIIGAGETSGVRRVATLPYYGGSDH